VYDLNILDESFPDTGAFYVIDRGYIDFERLFVFPLCLALFVVGTKEKRLAAALLLATPISSGQDHGRMIRSHHHSGCHRFRESLSRSRTSLQLSPCPTKQRFKFKTNSFVLPALTTAQI